MESHHVQAVTGLCDRLRGHQVKIGEISCNPNTSCKQPQVDQQIPENQNSNHATKSFKSSSFTEALLF